ncbi:MAG: hypothetical protein H0X64_07270 [Gemmatimonadaceae bacterium]|nr:hypothetical protein [Gemmatimonadaceae bacterium]
MADEAPGGFWAFVADIRLTVLQSTLIGYRLLVDTYVAMQPHASPAALKRPATVNCTPEKIHEVISDLGVAGLTTANAQLLAYWDNKPIEGASANWKLLKGGATRRTLSSTSRRRPEGRRTTPGSLHGAATPSGSAPARSAGNRDRLVEPRSCHPRGGSTTP